MKVATETPKAKPSTFSDILPLEEEPPKKVPRDLCAVFKVRTVPTDNTSPQYEVTIPYFDEKGTVRQALKANDDIRRVVRGNAIADGTGFDAICNSVYRGEALRRYTLARDQAQREYQRAQDLTRAAAANAQIQADLDAATSNAARRGLPQLMDDAGIEQWILANPQVEDLAAASVELAMREAIRCVTPHQALEKVKRYLRRHCRKPAGMKIRQYAIRL